MRDYSKDIKVDKNKLEEEWLEQPSLFLYYAEAHAEAIFERDKAKSNMDYVYSVLYSKFKNNWQEYFDSKPTEPALKEKINTHEKYRKAEKRYIKANRNVNVLLSAKTAFDHRKRALENLVSLKISGFYSEPKNKNKSKLEGGAHKKQKTELNKSSKKRKRY